MRGKGRGINIREKRNGEKGVWRKGKMEKGMGNWETGK